MNVTLNLEVTTSPSPPPILVVIIIIIIIIIIMTEKVNDNCYIKLLHLLKILVS